MLFPGQSTHWNQDENILNVHTIKKHVYNSKEKETERKFKKKSP